jgi:hypothetical protein
MLGAASADSVHIISLRDDRQDGDGLGAARYAIYFIRRRGAQIKPG